MSIEERKPNSHTHSNLKTRSIAQEMDSFYKTELGQLVCETLRRKIGEMDASFASDFVLGIGYPFPYESFLKEKARRVKLLATSKFSIPRVSTTWSEKGPLSLYDNQFDSIFVVHGLEVSRDPMRFLREMWRVLKPEGTMILVVPRHHRLGKRQIPWLDELDYSLSEIIHAIEQMCFVLLEKKQTLFKLPLNTGWRLWLESFLEKLASWGVWCPGEVWILRVQKQVYQATYTENASLEPTILAASANSHIKHS